MRYKMGRPLNSNIRCIEIHIIMNGGLDRDG